ncbi:MAG: aminoglycoside phosphotransferase family protein [Lachnospiraceae bacterium]|nr:aminoglycoside phosphotransferase family protein [Lachnospiraceae bacterium]
MQMITQQSIQPICRQFIPFDVRLISSNSKGLINDTFLVGAEGKMYVVQRLNRNMNADFLEFNYGLYSKACEENNWLYPKWIKDSEGDYFYTDSDDDKWRMYPFISCEILEKPLSKERLFSLGQGLARMHEIFDSIDDKPKAVYPMLHDLSHYYDEYKRVISENQEERDEELEKKIDDKIDAMLNVKLDTSSVIHADTKLSNILFDNGKVVGSIDMDTIMSGSVLEDIADSIRSSCVSGDRFDRESAEEIIKGYINFSSKKDIQNNLPPVFNKICFELALRYYTDSLSEEKYFRETYPGYCRERAMSLLNTLWG